MTLLPKWAFGTTLVVAVVSSAAPAAAAPTITEFNAGLTSNSAPTRVAPGPDGNVWFTDASGAVGKITPAGAITEYTSGLTANSRPAGITAGPDGNMWFTESFAAAIGKITPAGVITEVSLANALGSGATPEGIAAGPDGNLWVTDTGHSGSIDRVTPQGAVTAFSNGLTPAANPWSIVRGPDGNMWFTESYGGGTIAKVSMIGAVTEYAALAGRPQQITAGSDGNLWFTESYPGRIGRITTAGTVSQFATGLLAYSSPDGIATGNDGQLYFTDNGGAGAIGSSTTGGAIAEYTAGLTANSRPAGITAGPDGNVWFTESAIPGRLGRLSAPPPSAGTQAASGVGPTSAVLNGVVNPVGAATTYDFDYGTSTAYGQRAPASEVGVGSDSTTHTVSQNPGGLTPSTAYHFRIVATRCGGCPAGTTYGADQTFTTLSGPAVHTASATGVGLLGASLNATVNPNGSATTYHFEYGTSTSYGSRLPLTDAAVGSDSATHQISQGVVGLLPNTTYHARVLASNCDGCATGTSYGNDETFATARLPLASTGSAGQILDTVATLNGTLNPSGVAATYHFDYGVTASYGSSTPETLTALSGATDLPASASLTGLMPATPYHFRLVVSDCAGCAAGTVLGGDMLFSTLAATGGGEGPGGPGNPGTPGTPGPPGNPAPGTPGGGTGAGGGPPTGGPGASHPHPGGGSPGKEFSAAIPPNSGAAFGRSGVATVVSGTVLVALPGSSQFQPLSGAASIPMGSLIDATNGAVKLTVSLGHSGHTQSVTLSGGMFRARQKARLHGMTDILLAGGNFASCTSSGSTGHLAVGSRPALVAFAARTVLVAFGARTRRPAVRSLWASDHHGRFRTYGRNSVATVRGTSWLTEDRCDGTLTQVKAGKVSVRVPGVRRGVLVTAGHSYLAPRRH